MTEIYRQHPETAGRRIGGNTFIVRPRDSTLHRLNETASDIWQLAEDGIDVSGAVRQLSARYDVEPSAIADEVAAACDRLQRLGILVAEPGEVGSTSLEIGTVDDRRHYVAPDVLSEETFERHALQCNKASGAGAFCDLSPSS